MKIRFAFDMKIRAGGIREIERNRKYIFTDDKLTANLFARLPALLHAPLNILDFGVCSSVYIEDKGRRVSRFPLSKKMQIIERECPAPVKCRFAYLTRVKVSGMVSVISITYDNLKRDHR